MGQRARRRSMIMRGRSADHRCALRRRLPVPSCPVRNSVRKRLSAGLTTVAVGAGVALVAGASPAAAAVTSRQVFYVADSGDRAVLVFDATSNEYINRIDVGVHPIDAAITPDHNRAYVTNSGSNTVSVIDTASSTVTATVGVAADPRALAIAPDGGRAYVVSYAGSAVSVINTATNTVAATIPTGLHPLAVALTPDGRRAYVSNSGAQSISVIDTATNTVTATVPVGVSPRGVAVTPDGRHVYAANYSSGTISVIDIATNAVTATVVVGAHAGPYNLAVTPDGGRVYVGDFADGTVSVIDTATNTVTATVPVAVQPSGIAVTPDGGRAYVSNSGSQSISVIDTATNKVSATVAAGNQPSGIAFTTVRPGPPTAHLAISAPGDSGTITVDASGTKHGFAPIIWYTFDFGDGQTVTQSLAATDHTYGSGGTYTVKVTVTDAGALSSTTSESVTVRPFVRTTALLSLSTMSYVSAESAGSLPLVANRPAAALWEWFDLIDTGNGTIALRAEVNGRYLRVDAANGSRLVANGSVIDDASLFRPVYGAYGVLSLQSRANNKYVSSNNGAGPLTADRTAIGPWEQFYRTRATSVTFDALVSGYVTAEAAGSQPLIANRHQLGPWETFDEVDAGDGWVALFAHANSRFVTAEAGGSQPLIANRTQIGVWEKFKVINNPDGTQSLLANVNGRYVTAESAGSRPLIANRTQIGPWETFTGLF
ncbi:beta-propeller fold lactonase family protein [Dactylosporangium sp. CA-092794]|uniref:YVTN family beta-propeller repeat protein n=1 Tax=Dactylosporangium sp. CA-092794 TaxID=3239929 RepID=UPI003D932574